MGGPFQNPPPLPQQHHLPPDGQNGNNHHLQNRQNEDNDVENHVLPIEQNTNNNRADLIRNQIEDGRYGNVVYEDSIIVAYTVEEEEGVGSASGGNGREGEFGSYRGGRRRRHRNNGGGRRGRHNDGVSVSRRENGNEANVADVSSNGAGRVNTFRGVLALSQFLDYALNCYENRS